MSQKQYKTDMLLFHFYQEQKSITGWPSRNA